MANTSWLLLSPLPPWLPPAADRHTPEIWADRISGGRWFASLAPSNTGSQHTPGVEPAHVTNVPFHTRRVLHWPCKRLSWWPIKHEHEVR